MLHLLDVLTGDAFEAVDTLVLIVEVDPGEVQWKRNEPRRAPRTQRKTKGPNYDGGY